ncbi:MAG: hypothetical protein ACLFSQ_02090 [Candidatus Zixiibacteriota bacterium]
MPIFAQFSGDDFGRADSPSSKKDPGEKSLFKAALMSLAIPGTGEHYLGNNSSYILWSIESATWLTYIGFGIKGNMLEDEFRAYAVKHAGIDPKGKPDHFFTDISGYDSRYEYNYYELLFERDEAELYPETAEYFWNWDSDESRSHFYDLRENREQIKSNMRIVISVAALNRLASIINVLRIGTNETPELNKGFTLNARAYPSGIKGDRLKLGFTLTKNF